MERAGDRRHALSQRLHAPRNLTAYTRALWWAVTALTALGTISTFPATHQVAYAALVLTGAGRAFCAGLDAKGFASNPLGFKAACDELLDRPDGEISNLAQDVAYLWRRIAAPVICATHGVCLGGGFQIALGAEAAMGFSVAPTMPRATTAARMSTVSMASFYDFSATTIDGSAAPMSAYKGKPTLIVNVASL